MNISSGFLKLFGTPAIYGSPCILAVTDATLSLVKTISLIVAAVCFCIVLYVKRKANKEGRDIGLTMSKGSCALIGAILGMITEYIILGQLEGEKWEFNTFTFLLLLPGAIIGAVIGFATGQDKSTDRKNDSPSNPQQDSTTELMNYKKLLDEGIITQEEFDKKKQEILERK